MKTCKKCNKNKDLSCFWKQKRAKDGLRSDCKDCNRIEHQKWVENNRDKTRESSRKFAKENRDKAKKKLEKWRKKNPEKVKDYRLKKRYGITIDQYNDTLEKQNHCCYICKKHKSEFDKPFGVDHCHTTGKVRGLLCGKCNRAIGLLEDNKDIINSAKEYLEKNT